MFRHIKQYKDMINFQTVQKFTIFFDMYSSLTSSTFTPIQIQYIDYAIDNHNYRLGYFSQAATSKSTYTPKTTICIYN